MPINSRLRSVRSITCIYLESISLVDSCLLFFEKRVNTFATRKIIYRSFAPQANWVTIFINSVPLIILYRALSTGSTPLVTEAVCQRKT